MQDEAQALVAPVLKPAGAQVQNLFTLRDNNLSPPRRRAASPAIREPEDLPDS
jgi:hypothetical protein